MRRLRIIDSEFIIRIEINRKYLSPHPDKVIPLPGTKASTPLLWHIIICGDASGDDAVNVGDAVYTISYVFKAGLLPIPTWTGDTNGDDTPNVGDAVYLINYIFRSGPAPNCS